MPTELTSISGIGPAAAELLKQHGFNSAEAIATASVEQLSQVPGFGAARSANAITAAIELTGSPQPEKNTVSEAPAKQTEEKPAEDKKKTKKDKNKSKDKKDKKDKKKKKDKKSGKDKKDKKKKKKK
jgi:Holliday junction resolvasome RuvABC DNA-binding subunit